MSLCYYPSSGHDSLSSYNVYANQTDFKCLSKEYLFKNGVILHKSLSLFYYRGTCTVKFEELILEIISLILNIILVLFKIK